MPSEKIIKTLDSIFEESVRKAHAELAAIDLALINSLGISKVHSDLLGSHTVVTYPPLDSLAAVTDADILLRELQFEPEVNLYVHVPFCGYPCKFCPYTTLTIDGKDGQKMSPYFNALEIEMAGWAKRLKKNGSKVRSVYFGGGTPFELPKETLEWLVGFVIKNFELVKNPEICVETAPIATIQSDAQWKLEMLKKYGVNRMSIGIQSFDFESLRDMARTFKGHTDADEENAVQVLMDSGIGNINVDMIQDLPLLSGQAYLKRLKHDLFKIAELKPHHVTWYNMRLRPETTYARRKIRLVTPEESLLTRLAIWNFMEAIGSTVLEGDRFALNESYQDNFRKVRGSVDADLIGMGVSAYSHVFPAFFQNTRETGRTVREDSKIATDKYIEQVMEHGHAITFGYEMTPDERMAGMFALGLKKGVDISQINEYGLEHIECGPYYHQVCQPNIVLLDAGLLEIDNGILSFTRIGRLFENEICARFYTPSAVYAAMQRRGDSVPDEVQNLFGWYAGAKAADVLSTLQKPLYVDDGGE